MKTAFAIASFAYGCLALAAATVWVVAGGPTDLPAFATKRETLLVIFVTHASFLGLTFQRFPGVKPFWAPLFKPTPQRLTLARLLIGGSFLLFAAAFIYVLVVLRRREEAAAIKGLGILLASMAALSSTYMIVHWALRPENIFTPQFLHFFRNPLLYLFHRKSR